jgi:hypothetical protein
MNPRNLNLDNNICFLVTLKDYFNDYFDVSAISLTVFSVASLIFFSITKCSNLTPTTYKTGMLVMKSKQTKLMKSKART